jgi:hypothetical protein
MKTKMENKKGKKKNPFADIIGSKAAKPKGETKPGKASGEPRKVPFGQKGADEDHVNKAKGSGHKGSSRSMKKTKKVKK